jgi:hypothetical protein
MKPKSYTKRVNDRVIIATEGINHRYRDYFKITDYRVYHILHQTIPTRKNAYYPEKPIIKKMEDSFNILLARKILETI